MPPECLGAGERTARIHRGRVRERGHGQFGDVRAGCGQLGERRSESCSDILRKIVEENRLRYGETQAANVGRHGDRPSLGRQHLIEQRAIGDGFCDRPGRIKRHRQRQRAVERHALRRGLEADETVERGWNPHRATGIRANRTRCHSIRDRNRRAR